MSDANPMSGPAPSVQVPAGSPVIVQCGCQPKPAAKVWKVLRGFVIGGFALSLLVNLYLIVLVGMMFAGDMVMEKPWRDGAFSEKDRVVILEVDGGINDGSRDWLAQALKQLEANPPSAVVLRINSPGGAVGAADEMHHALEQFKKKHPQVKLVASFGSVAASGGYYIAMPCEYIVCDRTCITGSIGVIAQVPALGGLAKKVGVEMNTLIAQGSPHKADGNDLFTRWYDDAGNLTKEGDAARRELGVVLDSAYDRFYEVVKAGRVGRTAGGSAGSATLTDADVKAFANGRIYTAVEAEKLGVVDKVGYLEDAVDEAIRRAGVTNPKVTLLKPRTPGLLGRLAGANHDAPGVDLTNVQPGQVRDLLSDFGGVRLEYRLDFPR